MRDKLELKLYHLTKNYDVYCAKQNIRFMKLAGLIVKITFQKNTKNVRMPD